MKVHPETGNILLLWDRVGDYHAARFRALEKLLPEGKVFISDLGGSDPLYKWKNPLANHPGYKGLSPFPVDKPDVKGRFYEFRNWALKNNIRVAGIAGYGRTEYNLILLWCRLSGIKVVLFAESWYGSNLIFNRLKGLYLSRLCVGFLVSGERAKEHFFHRLGIRKRPIEIGYSVVDNAHFESAPIQTKNLEVLCVARFSQEKNLAMLIRAFRKAKGGENWTLRLVGGGPLKRDLHDLSAGDRRIIPADWEPYEALPGLYARAAFFILPSQFEPWGLVVNEAMAARLPVALSEACGCHPDLLSEKNGFSFSSLREEDVVEVLEKIFRTNPGERQAMGNASNQQIQSFSPEIWAERFLRLAGA